MTLSLNALFIILSLALFLCVCVCVLPTQSTWHAKTKYNQEEVKL